MEGKLSCHGFTDALLSVRSTLKEIKRHVLQIDWEACITDASSTAVASRIASETSWMKLWDIALDYGPRGSSSLQALYILGIDKATVTTRCLPSLWDYTGHSVLSSLYSLPHTSLRPRAYYQLPSLC